MKRNPFTVLASLAFVGFAAVSLSGCGPSGQGAESGAESSLKSGGSASSTTTPNSDPDSDASTGQGGAEFSYEGVSYKVELQLCSLAEADEALFHGPVYDTSGANVGYLSGDFTGLGDVPSGEARLNFGATKNMQSTDEFLAIGTPGGNLVITDSSNTSLIVMGSAWDQDNTPLPVATLRVNC